MCRVTLLPRDGVISGFEAALCHMGVVVENLEVEVAPDQFIQPSGSAWVALLCQGVRGARQQPGRDGAKAQVHAEVARPFHGRKVARFFVTLNALQEVIKQLLRTPASRGQFQLTQSALFKADRTQRGHGARVFWRPRRQSVCVALYRVAFQEEGIDFAQPCIFVRRKHAVGRARLGKHLVPLQHRMVFVGVHRHTVSRQLGAHSVVALQGLGLVVVVGEDGIRTQRLGQLGHGIDGCRVQHDEASLRVATQLTQMSIQLYQRFADELHAPVGPGQRGEDVGVEDKNAMHLLALGQCVVQGGMVQCAQVAPEPDKAGGVRGLHVHR